MWPFKEKEPKEKEPNHGAETVAELKAFRDIGETFNYLGRTCIVTGHAEWWMDIGIIPKLRFDHCDNPGVIHSSSASPAELPGLINQQKDVPIK